MCRKLSSHKHKNETDGLPCIFCNCQIWLVKILFQFNTVKISFCMYTFDFYWLFPPLSSIQSLVESFKEYFKVQNEFQTEKEIFSHLNQTVRNVKKCPGRI